MASRCGALAQAEASALTPLCYMQTDNKARPGINIATAAVAASSDEHPTLHTRMSVMGRCIYHTNVPLDIYSCHFADAHALRARLLFGCGSGSAVPEAAHCR